MVLKRLQFVFELKVTNDSYNVEKNWGYLGRCLFECGDNFRVRFPTEGAYYTRLQVLVVFQEKMDATTGGHM